MDVQLLRAVAPVTPAQWARWGAPVAVFDGDAHVDSVRVEQIEGVSAAVRAFAPGPIFEDFFGGQIAYFIFGVDNPYKDVHPVVRPELMSDIKSWLAGAVGKAGQWDGNDVPIGNKVRATVFLFGHRADVLSVGLIMETYRLLAENHYLGGDRTAARVRAATENIHVGDFQSLGGGYVAGHVARVVAEYNRKTACATCHPVTAATYLYYELVVTKPFVWLNNTVARLLFAWSLLRDGFPFPCHIWATGPRAMERHDEAIRRCSGVRRDFSALNAFALGRMDALLGNYLVNAERSTPPAPAPPARAADGAGAAEKPDEAGLRRRAVAAGAAESG